MGGRWAEGGPVAATVRRRGPVLGERGAGRPRPARSGEVGGRGAAAGLRRAAEPRLSPRLGPLASFVVRAGASGRGALLAAG